MRNIEELRRSNRTRQLVSSFVAHFAVITLVVMMVLTPSTILGENTIEVIATDTAGSASPPATTTLFLP